MLVRVIVGLHPRDAAPSMDNVEALVEYGVEWDVSGKALAVQISRATLGRLDEENAVVVCVEKVLPPGEGRD